MENNGSLLYKITISNNGGYNHHMGMAYSLTGDELLTYRQAEEILSEEVGRKIKYVNISEEDARKAMKGIGMQDWLVGGMIELYSIIRQRHAAQITNTVEQITGQKPILFL